jgi:hypothetical protein
VVGLVYCCSQQGAGVPPLGRSNEETQLRVRGGTRRMQTMKSAKEPAVGWCTPGSLRKLSQIASQVVLNRILPDGRGRVQLRLNVPTKQQMLYSRIRVR